MRRIIIILTTTLVGVWAVLTFPFWPAFITGWVALVIIAAALIPEVKETNHEQRNIPTSASGAEPHRQD